MKTDNFIKIILTVIAVNLTILSFKTLDIIPKANAENKIPKDANVRNYGLVPINNDGSISVKLIQDGVVDVRLRGIDEASDLRWEAIKVKSEN